MADLKSSRSSCIIRQFDGIGVHDREFALFQFDQSKTKQNRRGRDEMAASPSSVLFEPERSPHPSKVSSINHIFSVISGG
jgi:hypothetical protein